MSNLPRESLVEMWITNHGCPPPKGLKRPLLERSAAWHIQAKTYGGYSPFTRRALQILVKDRFSRIVPQEELDQVSNITAADSPQPEVGPVPVAVQKKTNSQERSASGAGSSTIDKATRAKAMPPRSNKPDLPALPVDLKPGARLIREWNGRMHVVEVLDKGFRMDGKDYRSLTAIAKRISGTHRSGPLFFGLAKRAAPLSSHANSKQRKKRPSSAEARP